MIIDKELIFSDDQSLVHATGSFDSTTSIDSVKDGGPYKGLWLFVKISTAVGSAASGASVAFALHTSNDGFSSDDDTLFSSGAIAEASLTANTVIVKAPVPLGLKQDVKMIYTVSGEAVTAGTVFAALVSDVEESF